MEFVPDDQTAEERGVEVPYWRDASKRKHGIEGKETGKRISTLKGEIKTAVRNLGGAVEKIERGQFPHFDPPREGFVVQFYLDGNPGAIPVAALPFNPDKPEPTDRMKKQALRQALYSARNALEAQHNLRILSPGANPLLPHLLMPGGDMTLAEAYDQERGLPAGSA